MEHAGVVVVVSRSATCSDKESTPHTHLARCQEVNPIATSAQVRLNGLRAYSFIRIGTVEEAIHANRFTKLHVCL